MFDLKGFRKEKKITQNDAAKLFGCKQSFISDIERGKSSIPDSYIDILKETYPDFDVGDYQMINLKFPQEEKLLKSSFDARIKPTKKTKGVPFYDIDVTATNIESFNDMPEVAEYNVDFKPFNDCLAMLPVVGDSMYPEFKNGDIIAIKEAPTSFILFGETHLVITKDGYRTVKKVRKHKEDDSKVILKPVNPNYDEAEILKEDIVKLYLVKGQFKTHSY